MVPSSTSVRNQVSSFCKLGALVSTLHTRPRHAFFWTSQCCAWASCLLGAFPNTPQPIQRLPLWLPHSGPRSTCPHHPGPGTRKPGTALHPGPLESLSLPCLTWALPRKSQPPLSLPPSRPCRSPGGPAGWGVPPPLGTMSDKLFNGSHSLICWPGCTPRVLSRPHVSEHTGGHWFRRSPVGDSRTLVDP